MKQPSEVCKQTKRHALEAKGSNSSSPLPRANTKQAPCKSSAPVADILIPDHALRQALQLQKLRAWHISQRGSPPLRGRPNTPQRPRVPRPWDKKPRLQTIPCFCDMALSMVRAQRFCKFYCCRCRPQGAGARSAARFPKATPENLARPCKRSPKHLRHYLRNCTTILLQNVLLMMTGSSGLQGGMAAV